MRCQKTKDEHCVLIDSNINSHSFAFSFDTRGAKEKASQKEKRRFSLSLFEKSSAKTFLNRFLQDVHSARPHCLVELYMCVDCLSAQPTALRIFHSFASSSSTALSLSIFFISHTIDITLSLNLTLVGRRFIIRFS